MPEPLVSAQLISCNTAARPGTSGARPWACQTTPAPPGLAAKPIPRAARQTMPPACHRCCRPTLRLAGSPGRAGAAQHPQVVIHTPLVRGADAAKGPFRQTRGRQVNRFLAGIRLRHKDHHHGFAVHALHRHLGSQRHIQHAGALRCQVFLRLVRVGHSSSPIQCVAFRIDLRFHAQQQIPATQTRLIGKCNNRFHDGLANLARPLGLNPRRLVGSVEFGQEVLGGAHILQRWCPTAPSIWLAACSIPSSLGTNSAVWISLCMTVHFRAELAKIKSAGKRKVCRGHWQHWQPEWAGHSNLGPAFFWVLVSHALACGRKLAKCVMLSVSASRLPGQNFKP